MDASPLARDGLLEDVEKVSERLDPTGMRRGATTRCVPVRLWAVSRLGERLGSS